MGGRRFWRSSIYIYPGQRMTSIQITDPGIIEEEFTPSGGTTGTQPVIVGPAFSGHFSKFYRMVHFEVQVDFDNITSFGTGQYYITLPFPSHSSYIFRDGCIHDISASTQYSISGHVLAGSNQMLLFSTASNGRDVPFEHNVPFNLNQQDNFHIAGYYIAEN
jgi:hypothetical protein